MPTYDQFGLSVPENFTDILDDAWTKDDFETEIVGSGCGSVEYMFKNRDERGRAARMLAARLETLAKELRRGIHNLDPDEVGS